ncbi:TetR/AcrR family transcriptional regulator [Brevibacillus massiliensis]|uniref:TetR/AcrR family transcriptional regulator n=1 Tax=Brevibacillus massiliensis TaxID=1118054 RepID=UPI001375C6DE|nr:TetR family transcriptional regulator [Brevibacillus massiliensis]
MKRYFGSKSALRTFLRKHHQQSKADTKSKILISARHVFATHGYGGATLDLVAQEAGMTKGAVYWHFSSKSDLFLALCEQSLSKLLNELPNQAHQVMTSVNPLKALELLLESEFDSCEAGSGERPLLFFEFVANSREPEIREKLAEAFSRLFLGTSDVMKELQRKGFIIETIDPHALSIALHSLINGVVLMWLLAPDQVDFKMLSKEISTILWHGIRPNTSIE